MNKPLMSAQQALPLIDDPGIIWYQRLALAEGVTTPGGRDLDVLLKPFDIPSDLGGLSVLDIGTTNGGVAFSAEQQGAERVVAVDIHDPALYGFSQIAAAIGSQVEYVRASIYELPAVLQEKFDVVFFLGVLYHLRHPLLAIDAIHELCRGRVFIETGVSGSRQGTDFYAGEYRGDTSNWFVPSTRCVRDWFSSSGFEIREVTPWRMPWHIFRARRGFFEASVLPEPPEWRRISYERPLNVAALDWEH
jgi:tRNA (mo5U34)-methyltransferase